MNITNIETPKLKEDIYKAVIARKIRSSVQSLITKDNNSEDLVYSECNSIILKCYTPEFSSNYDKENHLIVIEVKKGMKTFILETVKNLIKIFPFKIEISVLDI